MKQRIIRINNKWVVQRKTFFNWENEKEFEVRLKAEKYINKEL